MVASRFESRLARSEPRLFESLERLACLVPFTAQTGHLVFLGLFLLLLLANGRTAFTLMRVVVRKGRSVSHLRVPQPPLCFLSLLVRLVHSDLRPHPFRLVDHFEPIQVAFSRCARNPGPKVRRTRFSFFASDADEFGLLTAP